MKNQDEIKVGETSNQSKNERDFLLEALKQSGCALEYASDDLKADPVVVLEALKQNWLALEYASNDLKADRDFMLAAVKQYGGALRYASFELIGDMNLRFAAELNGYEPPWCRITEDIRKVYSNPQKLLEQISVIEDKEIDDPLILLCHFDSRESHEEKFTFLKVLLQKGDLIPHLAQRVECIQNTFSMQREACINALSRSPDDDALTKRLTALDDACNHINAVFLNYKAYSDPGKHDTYLCEKIITLIETMYGAPIITQDPVLSLLEQPTDAGEKAIIEAFSKQDYNVLVQKITTQKAKSHVVAPCRLFCSPNATANISPEAGDKGCGMAPTQP